MVIGNLIFSLFQTFIHVQGSLSQSNISNLPQTRIKKNLSPGSGSRCRFLAALPSKGRYGIPRKL